MRSVGFAALALIILAVGACASTNEEEGPVPIDATVDDAVETPDACGKVELCNGMDDNCNGQIDEGFNLDKDCTNGVGACQRAGKTICSADGKGVVCNAVPGTPAPKELCGNGIDDNCDGLVDEGFASLGKPCSNGVGACQRTGVYVCSADKLSLVCNAVPGAPGPELCGNGIDDNCDGQVNEGFPSLGVPCDGADTDLCKEGVFVCSADKLSTVCNDNTGNNIEYCNGVDDDCNPATADGSTDPSLVNHAACHGPKEDCNIGGTYIACTNGALVCSDQGTESTTNDPNNCGTCGNKCTNPEGTTSCVSSACDPICNYGWQSCDGNLNNGCETNRQSGDSCGSPAPLYIGQVDGDAPDGGNEIIQYTTYQTQWFRAHINESSRTLFGSEELTASVFVNNPAGVSLGLYVYCYSCGGGLIGAVANGPGAQERVDYRKEDSSGDDSADILINVVYFSDTSVTACNNYTVYVYGNEPVSNTTCN